MLKYIGTIIVLAIVIVVAIIYHSLSKSRKRVRELYSGVEVSLKRRWDLVPELVKVVRGYSTYEEANLAKLSKLREQNFEEFEIEKKIDVDSKISKLVAKMIAISENYPDLLVSQDYIDVSEQLMDLEEEICVKKDEYNNTVKEYNTLVEKVPYNIVAITFGFNEENKKF